MFSVLYKLILGVPAGRVLVRRPGSAGNAEAARIGDNLALEDVAGELTLYGTVTQGPAGPQGEQGPQGDPGANGANGQDGAPGPNQITAETDTNLIGFLKGDGNKASAVPAIPQSDVTNLTTDLAAKVGGSVGSINNTVPRASGTGTKTLKSSGWTISDTDALAGGVGSTVSVLSPNGAYSHTLAATDAGNATVVVGGSGNYSLTATQVNLVANSINHLPSGNSRGRWIYDLAAAWHGLLLINTQGYYIAGGTNSGVAPAIGFKMVTSGVGEINNGTPGTLGTITALVRPAPYTFLTVPSASAHTGSVIRITDRSQRQAYSDGTNWRFIADDNIIS